MRFRREKGALQEASDQRRRVERTLPRHEILIQPILADSLDHVSFSHMNLDQAPVCGLAERVRCSCGQPSLNGFREPSRRGEIEGNGFQRVGPKLSELFSVHY